MKTKIKQTLPTYYCWYCRQTFPFAQIQVLPNHSKSFLTFFACQTCQAFIYTWKLNQTTFFAPLFHIVLVAPEIAGNVGTIIRLAANFGFALHLIQPFGFIYSTKWLKRSSTHHFNLVKPQLYDDWNHFLKLNQPQKIFFTSHQGKQPFSRFPFSSPTVPFYIVFGCESNGLPQSFLTKHAELTFYLETTAATSLNLANSVAIVAYQIFHHYQLFPLQT